MKKENKKLYKMLLLGICMMLTVGIFTMPVQASPTKTANVKAGKAVGIKKYGTYKIKSNYNKSDKVTWVKFVAPKKGNYRITINDMSSVGKNRKKDYGYGGVFFYDAKNVRKAKTTAKGSLHTMLLTTKQNNILLQKCKDEGLLDWDDMTPSTDTWIFKLNKGEELYIGACYQSNIENAEKTYKYQYSLKISKAKAHESVYEF